MIELFREVRRGLQTLYIDVYFLVNFTVDLIAAYFGALFSKVPTSVLRIGLTAFVGACSAVVLVFMPPEPIFGIFVSVGTLFAMAATVSRGVRFSRRLKFIFSFLIFSSLVGGGAYFLFGIFDRYLGGVFENSGGSANGKILFFSVIVLFSIGVFKMIVSFFSNIEGEDSVEIEVCFCGKTLRTEAFVDSGNLAIDPMDMRPVMLIKESAARDLFPESVVSLRDPDLLSREERRRIRLIPISRGGTTHVLTGVRTDGVCVVMDGALEPISVTVAIDKEEGSYGGFDVLVPSAVIRDARKK